MKNTLQLPCKILSLHQTPPTIFPYKEKKNPEKWRTCQQGKLKLKLKTNLFTE